MEKNELTRKYELMIIVDAKLPDDEKDAVYKASAEAVQKGGSKTVNSQVWLEKHKFTFPIKKCMEGTYHLINFEGIPSAVEKVKSHLKLNEKILRFAIATVETHQVAEAEKV